MIQVLGDSHVCFFGGIDVVTDYYVNHPFVIHRLGAPLAYNLDKFNTSWKAREKILDLLPNIPKQDKVLFCLGEVDCRYHIKNQSIKQGRDIELIIEECAKRYVTAIKSFNIKQDIGVWAPIASTWLTEKQASSDRLILGSCLDRNVITKNFNAYLKAECKDDIAFFSIFDKLLEDNGETNKNYYWDTVHLSQKVMPIAKELLKEWL